MVLNEPESESLKPVFPEVLSRGVPSHMQRLVARRGCCGEVFLGMHNA